MEIFEQTFYQRKFLIVIGRHGIIRVIRLHRIGDVPYIYRNLTHESKIVNAVDSFFDSVPSVFVGFGLGGEHATLKAKLIVIMSGREEHIQSNRLRLFLWIESRVKMDQRLRRWDLGQSRTIFF